MRTKSLVYQNDSISRFKRNAYIFLLPIFVMAFLAVTIILFESGDLNFLNIFTFSSLGIGFFICFLLLLKEKVKLQKVEFFVCLGASFVTLLRTYDSILLNIGNNGDMHLGTFSYWMPLLYLLYFFTFRGKTALIFSITNFTLSLLPGIYYIFFNEHAVSEAIYSLLQFYLAIIGNIICLYYFQRMLEAFLQAEAVKKEASTDFLTNIYNRRKMDLILIDSLNTAKTNQDSISAILFDVDYFKRINDTYGHDVGDSVLKELSSLILKSLPSHAFFGRWGGEEFLIISIDPNGYQLAEDIRKMIANHRFSRVNQLTCSFGVSVSSKDCLPNDLIKRADEALYSAKENGRNQVQFDWAV
ncbi:GGDEF domain-containing protein [Pseudoneobacillus sp. C159]